SLAALARVGDVLLSLVLPAPRSSSLFPYTTLFRSQRLGELELVGPEGPQLVAAGGILSEPGGQGDQDLVGRLFDFGRRQAVALGRADGRTDGDRVVARVDDPAG